MHTLYATHPSLDSLRRVLASGQSPILLGGLHGSATAYVLAALDQAKKSGTYHTRPYLVVLNDDEAAGYLYHDMVQILGASRVFFLPSTYRRAVKYAQRDAANEILRADAIATLGNSASWSQHDIFVITYPTALAERVASREEVESRTIRLSEGDNIDMNMLSQRLDELGFRRRDYVYEPGEYALRGSILDVFSFSSEYPYRIDFFGDEVDSLRTFEIQTQLSRDRITEACVMPDVDATADGLVPFSDLLPDSCCVVCHDLKFVADAVQQIYDEGFAQQAIAEREAVSEMDAERIRQKLTAASLLVQGETILRGLGSHQTILLGASPSRYPHAEALTFSTRPQPIFHKNLDLLRETLAQSAADGYSTVILASTEKQTERLREILADSPAEIRFVPSINGDGHGMVCHAGFVDETLRRAVFTDHEIFDRYHKYNLRSDHARNAKIALTQKELMQFSHGDYVVHIDHGIGQFAGLVRLPGPDGSMQEMIKILYRNNDAVFVSIHALHKVSKYKGKEGTPPRISSLGTGAWEKLKDRTKKKIKDIARDLIALYAKRREEQGFAFSPDSYLQQELEASFKYEDTPDQLKVTQQVKADMERPRPMDRLVCGDVGFGKTEIAVRAAFKAATDSKQVAVLVPTTVLAAQHYRTFSSRLKDFPVRIEYLSRARTAKQTREILADLEAGKIDILVGTHKLIGKQVKFRDLGLLIIDEEQKFGVSTKEKLRQLKVNVDTLTMSATPIPRTLQFSLMGARDLSLIQTPPPNRHPIQTEVHTFGAEIIADAVGFELSRSGQVFFVTNRISALNNIKRIIEEHVPDARVAIGHGQMPPEKLEQVITDFVNQDIDVLVSTTIVENGIDIPNANTIIIDAAHHFGLSDLHQMRGRVGRGNRKAFCYLLAPPLALLPDDSRRRLEAIENFSDLGSGIHIAMQDLDIRGAGNLLGAEQSGFIADLGYETYLKILNEAIAELMCESGMDVETTAESDADAGTKAQAAGKSRSLAAGSQSVAPNPLGNTATDGVAGMRYVADCSIDCDLHAYFPETYVPGATERMLLYRELDGLTEEAQVEAYRQRLIDRFGQLPPEGEELLRVGTLRRLGCQCGCERIALKNHRMVLYFVANTASPFYRSSVFARLIAFATSPANIRRCQISEPNGKPQMRISGITSVQSAIDMLSSMLDGKDKSDR